jgi:hypothetical protein
LLKDQSNEQKLELCALRKSVNDNQDQNRAFSLFSLEPNDGCNKDSLPSRLDKDTVVYLKINEPFLCQFTQVIKNVQSLNPNFVIIGSDGPIVSKNVFMNTNLLVFNIIFLKRASILLL